MRKATPYLILIAVFAAASWYFFIREPNAVHEAPPPQLAPAISAETQQPEPQYQETPAYPVPELMSEPEIITQPLPILNESDPEVTRDLAGIAGDGPLAQYLVMDQVISRAVASIDSLTSRQVPVHINPIRPAGDKFLIETEGENLVLNEQNFARYEGYVELLQNMDTDSLIVFYRYYHPLFQQAWEENGGTGSFNDRLLVVIDDLLETPDVPGPVHLTKSEAVYLFENPELEAMTAGQKVLVRMGSANASVVKEKLVEVRAALNP